MKMANTKKNRQKAKERKKRLEEKRKRGARRDK